MSPHVAATTPYPWPFDADLTGSATALLVVAPSGAPAPAEDVTAAVRHLAAAVRHAGGVVIATTTTAPARLGPPANATGATARDLLDGVAPDHEVVAGGVDAFYASNLDLLLRTRGIARLLLAGVGLETGVHSTMRDANDRGYECLLVVDACEPVDEALTASAVSMVEMSGGIFGAVGRTADVLAALDAAARDADDPAPTPAPTEGDLR